MFDQFDERQKQRKNGGAALGVLGAVAAIVVALLRCQAAQNRNREMEQMNDLFRSSPALADTTSPSRVDLPGMSLEMPGTPDVSGTYQNGVAKLGDSAGVT